MAIRTRWLLMSLLSVLAVIASGDSHASAAEGGSRIEQSIPGTMHFVLAMDDAAAAAEKFNRTSMGSMLGSESWRPFLNSLRKDRIGCLLNPQPWFGVEWGDISDFPIPAALVIFSTGPRSPAAALIVDVQSNEAAGKALRSKAEKYFREQRASVAGPEKSSDKRTVFEFVDGSGVKRQRVCLETKGLLVFVSSTAGANELSKFWANAAADSLGKQPDFDSIFKKGEPQDQKNNSSIRWWVRPLPLAQILRKPPPPGRRGARGDWVASMERLGLEQVRAIGGGIRIEPGTAPEWDLQLRVIAPQPYKLALQLAVLEKGTWLDPAAWVHQDIDFWGMAYRDPLRWFDGLGSLFDEIVDPGNPGSFGDVVDAIKEDPCGPKIDVKNDIVPQLDSLMVQVVDHGGAKIAINPDGRRVILVLSTKANGKLVDLFDAMFQNDPAVQKEKAAKYTLWSTKTGEPLFIAAGQKKRLTVTSLAVVANEIYLSTDKDWLVSVLDGRQIGPSLTKHPLFPQIHKHLLARGGNQAGAWGIAMLGGTLRPAYEQIRSGKQNSEDDAMRGIVEVLLFGSMEGFNPAIAKQLPDWKDVAPAIGTSGVSFSPTPDGFAGVWGIWPESKAVGK